MNSWNDIQNILYLIEEDISENFEIAVLAEKAHLSQFYFQRLFSRLVGKPVKEYIKLRRLALAADYLKDNKTKVIDVALKYGFENHETFTRAFKDTYGMTPDEYRKSPRPLSHFLVPQLALKYELVDENVPLVVNGIVLEIRRTRLEHDRFFCGLSVQNPMNGNPGIDLLAELWNTFHQGKGQISGLVPGGHEAGVSSPGEKEGYFTYFAGAEVSDHTSQDDFTNWVMPEGDYVSCSFDAENFQLLTTDALDKVRDYLFGTWLRHHNLKTDPFMIELYSDTSPDATNMEIWVRLQQ